MRTVLRLRAEELELTRGAKQSGDLERHCLAAVKLESSLVINFIDFGRNRLKERKHGERLSSPNFSVIIKNKLEKVSS